MKTPDKENTLSAYHTYISSIKILYDDRCTKAAPNPNGKLE